MSIGLGYLLLLEGANRCEERDIEEEVVRMGCLNGLIV